MPGPAPNPGRRYSRYARGRQQIVLPVKGREGPAPKLPVGRTWSKEERALWRELWASPQATVWLESQASAVAMYVVHACAVYAGTAFAWQAQEARYLADKLGLTSAGMASLNWTPPDEEAETERAAGGWRGRSLERSRSTRDRLKVVDPRDVLRDLSA